MCNWKVGAGQLAVANYDLMHLLKVHAHMVGKSKVDQCVVSVCVCMYGPQECMHVCVYMCDHAGGMLILYTIVPI